MLKIMLGGIGVSVLLVLVIAMVIIGKIFGKPIGFLLKIAGIIIGLLFIAGAIIASLPYLLIGGIILILSIVLFKLLFHRSKG